MLIPIRDSPDGRPEWAIIEWQGDVEHRPEHVPNEDGTMDVGQLSVTVRRPVNFIGTPTILIHSPCRR